MLSKFDAVYSQLRTIKNMMKGSTAGHATEQISQGIPEDLQPVELKPVELKPCPICRRTFNPTTLEKHVTICEKTSQKRKVFDSFLQRSTGIGVGAGVSRSSDLPKTKKYDDGPRSFKSKKKETTVMPKSQQDSTNRNMNRLATTSPSTSPSASTSASTSASVSTSASTSNAPKKQPKVEARPRASYWESKPLEQCPYCGRTFNDKALEGHVEWCKSKTVYGTFNQFCTTNNSPAKERMIARIHYQPPKPKRK
ncbi:hypothetical protein ACLKA7_007484 [Drosophila subpalustris]